MPYSNISDLPERVRNVLPKAAQEIYLEAFNGAYHGTCKENDACASRVAWAQVKEDYEKDEETGKWHRKKGTKPLERKSFPFELDAEEKALDMEERTFKGYAAICGHFDGQDIIEYGAFKKTLQETGHRVKIYWIHDSMNPIGKPIELKEVPRSKLPAKVLERAPDATGGLLVHGRIDPIPEGDRALIQMKSGTLDEMSIGFNTIKASYVKHDELDGMEIRHIKEIALLDVSPVPMAMQEGAILVDVKRHREEVGMEEELKKGNIDSIIGAWNQWAGSFTKCVEVIQGVEGITEPQALCAWLHHEAEGIWPGEGRSAEEAEELKAQGRKPTAGEAAKIWAHIQKLLAKKMGDLQAAFIKAKREAAELQQRLIEKQL